MKIMQILVRAVKAFFVLVAAIALSAALAAVAFGATGALFDLAGNVVTVGLCIHSFYHLDKRHHYTAYAGDRLSYTALFGFCIFLATAAAIAAHPPKWTVNQLVSYHLKHSFR